PNELPRFAWKSAMGHMLSTVGVTDPGSIGIPLEAVTRWFEDHAPEQLALAQITPAEESNALKIKRHEYSMRGYKSFHPASESPARSAINVLPSLGPRVPGVSNVQFLDLV